MCAIAFDFYSVLLQALIFITLNTIGFIEGSKTVGMTTLGEWMKQEFPDTEVCPHKSDYCPSCFAFKISLSSIKQKISLHQVYNRKQYIVRKLVSGSYFCKYRGTVMLMQLKSLKKKQNQLRQHMKCILFR